MDGDHPFLSRCVVSYSFMVCSGLHVSLRLLSLLRVMNISPSRKKKKKKREVKQQASKQQSGQQQASLPQLTPSELAGSQPIVEQQADEPDDEPLLEAIFPFPGGFSLPTVMGPPAALARLYFAPSSAAEGLGAPLPVTCSPRADIPDAASRLAGKRRGPESMSDAESSGAAEAPIADSLALVPLTPDDSHAPSL